ncbi:MAG TPA: hypothetical protein VF780_07985, partial [Nitrosospira sp.]
NAGVGTRGELAIYRAAFQHPIGIQWHVCFSSGSAFRAKIVTLQLQAASRQRLPNHDTKSSASD